jgi:hypothetical protein
MIRETIVTTRSVDGSTQIVPLGVREQGEFLVLAPFKPSTTLENLLRERCAVINYTDDVRIFAGCLTGRYDWPLTPADQVPVNRLQDTLAHTEVRVETVEDDPVRSRFLCRPVHAAAHRPFSGFNRAQSAVIEAAILVSRLHLLPAEKIATEVGYLTIAIEKTAGPREQQAWQWLMEAIAACPGANQRGSCA